MAELEVARLAELEEGVPRPVNAFGREIALVRWRDKCYAVRNICPHQTVAFSRGVAHGQLRSGSRFGDVVVDMDDPVIRCPRHAFKFELRTGQCTADPKLRIKIYAVSVRDGRVFLGDDRA